MSRKARKLVRTSGTQNSRGRPVVGREQQKANQHSRQGHFERFACQVAHLAGRPTAFLLALLTILIWGFSGPLFGFSDTWQLVINTSTTIITFLMVFLIQNSQNRDTTALQIKLDALIFASRGTKNTIAAAEHLSDRDLEQLHDEYHKQAERTLAVLHTRRHSPAHAKRKAA